MKKLLLGFTLTITILISNLSHAGNFTYSNDLQNDFTDQVSRKKEAGRLIVAPAKLCLGIEKHGSSQF
jgi:hypothetical protein